MATILVVDDVPTNRQYLVTLLGYFGHRMLEACDGEEALQVAKAENPHLIICDMVMPKLDGEELARRLRRTTELARVPIVFYSATYSLSQAQVVARSVDAYGVIPKPSSPQTILEVVNKALGVRAVPVAAAKPMPEVLEGRQVPSIVEKLPDDPTGLEAVSYRLAALIEMSLQLTAERDPDRLLEGVAHMARKLVPSKFSAVTLVDEAGQPIRYLCSTGREVESEGMSWPADAPALAKVIEENRSARSLLSIPFTSPFASPLRTVGSLCLMEKLGEGGFSVEDHGIAATLASHGAAAYQKVAERKQAEDHIVALNLELRARVEELQAANHSLEAFGYSVSHDLRAPLRAIEGYAAILSEDHMSNLDEKGKQAVKVISANCTRMGLLIDALLEFSRVSRADLRKSEVDMTALVQSVVDESCAHEPGRRIEIAVEPLPPAIGDPEMLRQVFTNLISNARKFTQHTAGARIEIGSSRKEHRNVYFVADNGAGFDMTFAPKLFGVFKRLHTENEFEGTGIGLAVVRQLVQRHGGEVWAEGKVGQGATFYLTL